MIYGYDSEFHLTQPGLGAPPMVVASIAWSDGAELLDPDQAVNWLAEVLADPTAHLVGSATSVDLAVAVARDPDLLPLVFKALDEGRIHDVAIREALIDISKGELQEFGDDEGARYNLALLVLRHLGIDRSAAKAGGWRKSYALLEGVPFDRWPEEAREYALDDARDALAVFGCQERLYGARSRSGTSTSIVSGSADIGGTNIGESSRSGAFNLHREADEVPTDFALRLASIWGWRANRAAVAALRAKVDGDWAKTLKELQKVGIYRDDGSKNTKLVQQLVTAAYGGQPPYTSPSSRFPDGQVATDRDTLVESGDPLLMTLGTTGKSDKFRTTYIPKLELATEVPYLPFYNVLVATGRVSSDCQQFPKKGGVRECIEARPGWIFSSVDYEGGELRTMAQVAHDTVGYSVMGDALLAGKEVHAHVAAQFVGMPYELMLKDIKAKDPRAKDFRQLAKIFNFGKGGGMGAGAMAYNAREGKDGDVTIGPDGTRYVGSRFCILTGRCVRCGDRRVDVRVKGKTKSVCADCVEVSRKLGTDWLQAWPEQGELFERAAKLSDEYPSGFDVVCPRTGWVRGGCGYTQILNTPFQRLLAVAAKRATVRVTWECFDRRSPLWGSHLSLNVHDELITEHPADVAPDAAERVGVIMVEELVRLVPDVAGAVRAEPALGRTMSKSVATVRDPAGRLMVWVGQDADKNPIGAPVSDFR